MKKGYVGLLACASGILIGLGISRLDLTGYLEKTQEQEYHPVERKVPESVESKLKDPKQCWLCGSDERSMMDYFRKFDDLGVICTNHWYVMDMHIRNHDEDGNLTGPQGNGHMGYTGTGEGGCFFHTEQMSDYGISEVSVDYGEDSIFDVKKYRTICVRNAWISWWKAWRYSVRKRKNPSPVILYWWIFRHWSCTPFRSIMRDTLSGIIMWKLSRRKMGWK